MSDGPHRSLPLKPHWKVVAERGSRDVWSADEVAEAARRAVERDLAEIPMTTLRSLLGVDVPSLFSDDVNSLMADLDLARAECRGSAVGNAAIDGAVAAVSEGLASEEALRTAVEYASERNYRSQSRSIEEHYRREAGERSAKNMRARLDEAGSKCNFGDIAERHTRSGKSLRGTALSRHTGLDEGPEISQ